MRKKCFFYPCIYPFWNSSFLFYFIFLQCEESPLIFVEVQVYRWWILSFGLSEKVCFYLNCESHLPWIRILGWHFPLHFKDTSLLSSGFYSADEKSRDVFFFDYFFQIFSLSLVLSNFIMIMVYLDGVFFMFTWLELCWAS